MYTIITEILFYFQYKFVYYKHCNFNFRFNAKLKSLISLKKEMKIIIRAKITLPKVIVKFEEKILYFCF